MSDTLKIHSSVGLAEGCPMRVRAYDGGVVEFRAGPDGDEFDVSFDVATLRRFIELGARALAEAEALLKRGQADADESRGTAVGVA